MSDVQASKLPLTDGMLADAALRLSGFCEDRNEDRPCRRCGYCKSAEAVDEAARRLRAVQSEDARSAHNDAYAGIASCTNPTCACDDRIRTILENADDIERYATDDSIGEIVERIHADLKTLADAYRAKQASDDEKMPDVPDSTLTRGQARELARKPAPESTGIEILTSATLRPYESPLFDGPRQATEITFVCPTDWDVTRFMRTLREALK